MKTYFTADSVDNTTPVEVPITGDFTSLTLQVRVLTGSPAAGTLAMAVKTTADDTYQTIAGTITMTALVPQTIPGGCAALRLTPSALTAGVTYRVNVRGNV